MQEIVIILGIVVNMITILTFVIVQIKNIKRYRMKVEEEQTKPIIEIKNDLKEIKLEIKELQSEQRVNEKDRLKDSILAFGDKLRMNNKDNVFDITVHSFYNVFKDYDKYKKKLNGNGFVDAEMDYIKKEFEKYHND